MWRRRRALKGLDNDIRDHIARETEDNIARGMAPDEARRQALVTFRSVSLTQEDTRAVWAWRWLDELIHDTRYAARTLRKNLLSSSHIIDEIISRTVRAFSRAERRHEIIEFELFESKARKSMTLR